MPRLTRTASTVLPTRLFPCPDLDALIARAKVARTLMSHGIPEAEAFSAVDAGQIEIDPVAADVLAQAATVPARRVRR